MYFDVVFREQNFLKGVDCDSPSRFMYFYYPRKCKSTLLPLDVGLRLCFWAKFKGPKLYYWTNHLFSNLVGTIRV